MTNDLKYLQIDEDHYNEIIQKRKENDIDKIYCKILIYYL